jgi:hypothetical protein
MPLPDRELPSEAPFLCRGEDGVASKGWKHTRLKDAFMNAKRGPLEILRQIQDCLSARDRARAAGEPMDMVFPGISITEEDARTLVKELL